MSDVFTLTSLRPAGRMMVVTNPVSFYQKKQEYICNSVSIWREYRDEDGVRSIAGLEMIIDMCDNTYEIVGAGYQSYVLLVYNETTGWVTKAVPKWAVERIITREKEPEYYV